MPPHVRRFPILLAMRQARLSAAACAARKLTPAALPLFTDGEPGELVLPECSQLEPAVLAPALASASGEQCAPQKRATQGRKCAAMEQNKASEWRVALAGDTCVVRKRLEQCLRAAR